MGGRLPSPSVPQNSAFGQHLRPLVGVKQIRKGQLQKWGEQKDPDRHPEASAALCCPLLPSAAPCCPCCLLLSLCCPQLSPAAPQRSLSCPLLPLLSLCCPLLPLCCPPGAMLKPIRSQKGGGRLTFLQHDRLSQRGVGSEVVTLQAVQGLHREGSPPAKVNENDHRHPPCPAPSTWPREGGGRGRCSTWVVTAALNKRAGRQGCEEQLPPSWGAKSCKQRDLESSRESRARRREKKGAALSTGHAPTPQHCLACTCPRPACNPPVTPQLALCGRVGWVGPSSARVSWCTICRWHEGNGPHRLRRIPRLSVSEDAACGLALQTCYTGPRPRREEETTARDRPPSPGSPQEGQ